ncbi:hypothetical protein [Vulcanisaeta sp. EB80]|uniref:hypothetical protein n=1 Tax=Vulcanisaeta sp. EB80 TaxID=1650660 RepID=UPI00117F3CEF|nr:hypothetical protein [Vulcanisaeta sp. EB80]
MNYIVPIFTKLNDYFHSPFTSSNTTIPYSTIQYLHAIPKTFTASLEKSPAMLARGDPMTRHRMQNEGGGEETSQKGRRSGITQG